MSKEYELTQAETSFAELSQEEQRKRSQEWAMLLAMAAMPTIDTALYGKSGTIYGNNVYDNLESQGTQGIYKGSTTSWKPTVEEKKIGKFIDNTTDPMTEDERRVVNDLIREGKTVERIPKDPESVNKSPDFMIEGVKTELKTLQNANTNTGMKRIQEGFKQGVETVIIDARGSGLTVSQVSEIINRVNGKYSDGQLPASVEFWIDKQIIKYP